MKFTQAIIPTVLGLILVGCASPTWVKTGASDQNLITDKYYCERDVRQSNFHEVRESDEAQAAGGYTAAGDSIGSGMSALGAAIGRKQFFNRCMEAHGWRDQSDAPAQTPISIRATAPASTNKAPDNSTAAMYSAPPTLPACTKEEADLAAWARQKGYAYGAACQ